MVKVAKVRLVPRRLSTLLWVARAAALIVFADTARADEDWRLFSEVDGIRAFERETALGHVYRATATVRASREHISAVTRDFDRHSEWMMGCTSSRLLRYPSVLASVGYHRMRVPLPFVSDRDIIIHGSGAFDPNVDRIVINFEAIEDPRMPPVFGLVRMTRLSGRFILTDLGGGDTFVAYELAADAGGWLPRALVHLYFRDIPRETLRGLRAQVEKGGYDEVVTVMRSGLELTWQGDLTISGVGTIEAAQPRTQP